MKATILAALLYRADRTGVPLSQTEQSQATAMIEHSDNDAASALWATLGREDLTAFLKAAGMTRTVPGPGHYWGLSQVNVRDELSLLDVLTGRTKLLSASSRQLLDELMSNVEADQRWGAPAGAPADGQVQVKNGWLSRAEKGWRINSLAITRHGDDVVSLVLLSDTNASMPAGIGALEQVARRVHVTLGA